MGPLMSGGPWGLLAGPGISSICRIAHPFPVSGQQDSKTASCKVFEARLGLAIVQLHFCCILLVKACPDSRAGETDPIS